MQVLITKKASKQLDKLPDPLAHKIISELKQLATNPFPPNSKKLKGHQNYRLRIGSYRAIYTLSNRQITILRVADRKTIYRNF